MEKYLKISDAFDFDVACIEQRLFSGIISKEEATYAAHAIVSHDEPVAMNKELMEVIERVIGSSKELDKVMTTSEWSDGYKECAIDTGKALSEILDSIKAKGTA